MKPLRVFIGFDPRQPIAYTVAAFSAIAHCSRPVSITPLILGQLPLKRRGLTEFTYSRYLVPLLCDYQGSALFMDADTLVMGDLADLPWGIDAAVSFVPHERSAINGANLVFERGSVMLFNCSRCLSLHPKYIETGKPQSFEWANGSFHHLDPAWNHLVGYDTPRTPEKPAKLVHFTQGIPCFEETKDDEYAAEWNATLQEAAKTVGWEEIMGDSVHAQYKRRGPGVLKGLGSQMP